MTEATPSPMQTPDIGGLLRRTPREGPPTAPALVDAPLARRVKAAVEPVESMSLERLGPSAKDQTRRPAVEVASAVTRQPAPNGEPSRGGRQYLRSITLYLPRSVHQQLKTVAAEQETTATALILTAVNATHLRVGDVLQPRSVALPRGSAGSVADLFEIPQARRAPEPSVETTIRVTDAQLDAIKQLAATHGANRSQLITAALRLHVVGVGSR